MAFGRHPGPPCKAGCGWRVDAKLAGLPELDRHITCTPGPPPGPTDAERRAALLTVKLAELARLVATTRDVPAAWWRGPIRWWPA